MGNKLRVRVRETTIAGITAGLCLGGAAASPVNAAAVPVTRCTGTVTDQTITGDVQVPDGATCTLRRVTVRGNLKPGIDRSTLTITATRVTGDVDYSGGDGSPIQNAASFRSRDSRVDGTTYLTHTLTVSITDSALTGDVLIGQSCFHACYDHHVTATTVRDSRFGADLDIGFGTTRMSGTRVTGEGWFASDTTIRSSRLGSLIQRSTEHYTTIAPMAISQSTVTGNTLLDAHPGVPVRLGTNGGNRLVGDLTVKSHGGVVTMNHNTILGKAFADTVSDGDHHDNGLTLKGRQNAFKGGTGGFFTEFASQQ